jgi:hypothetical protein
MEALAGWYFVFVTAIHSEHDDGNDDDDDGRQRGGNLNIGTGSRWESCIPHIGTGSRWSPVFLTFTEVSLCLE